MLPIFRCSAVAPGSQRERHRALAADPGIRFETTDLIDHYGKDLSKPIGTGRPVAPMPGYLYETEHLVPLPYGYRYTGTFNVDLE